MMSQSTEEYRTFLRRKEDARGGHPLDPDETPDLSLVCRSALFDFQYRAVVAAIRHKRFGLFFATGLGKTRLLLAFADYVLRRHADSRVLVLTPLCTAHQVVREAHAMGLAVDPVYLRQDDPAVRLVITNYEMMEHFDFGNLTAIVLDEASILKHGDACKTAVRLGRMTHNIPYKLSLSATPCPNDYCELMQQAEFLQVGTFDAMLCKFFVRVSSGGSAYRLRTHATKPFCRWLATWSIWASSPADLGCVSEAERFRLPPLHMHELFVDTPAAPAAAEGPNTTRTRTTKSSAPPPKTGFGAKQRAARASLSARVAAVCQVVNEPSTGCEQWLVWAWLNDESRALAAGIHGAAEITGTDNIQRKTQLLERFAQGQLRVLVTKPDIAGFGLNLQNVSYMAFVGLTDSYEKFHQAVRRCWRFGQQRPVHVHVVKTDQTALVQANMDRKSEAAQVLSTAMLREMLALYDRPEESAGVAAPPAKSVTGGTGGMDTPPPPRLAGGNPVSVYLGDCVQVLRDHLPTDSVDYIITSPPFKSLYAYSDKPEDISNVQDEGDYRTHLSFCARELLRVLKPGRLATLHCMNVPLTKREHGEAALFDLRGQLVSILTQAGFLFVSETVVDRDPVQAMYRTKAHALFHRTYINDASECRQALPDFLVTFRKPGKAQEPITHDPDTLEQWKNYASPVWKVDHSDTLNLAKTIQKKRQQQPPDTPSAATDDERHPTCLQLPLIRRCMDIWTNPDDLVLDPFSGIGSVGVVAREQHRRYCGIELNEDYWQASCATLGV